MVNQSWQREPQEQYDGFSSLLLGFRLESKGNVGEPPKKACCEPKKTAKSP